MLKTNNISVSNFNELFNNHDGSKEKEFISCDDFLINLKELKENKICVYKTKVSSYMLIKKFRWYGYSRQLYIYIMLELITTL